MHSRIITLTFSPAIDKSTSVPLLIPEKKLKCSDPVYEPGGGGINVARAIKRLDGYATAIYFEGGCTGNVFTKLLHKESIDIIPIKTSGATRENLVVKEIETNRQFRFGMPGVRLTGRAYQKCLLALDNIPDIAYIVVSGSVPPGVPADIFVKIARIAKSKNAKLIVDTSGEALSQAIASGVYLIKPNLKELATLTGKEILGIDQVKEAAKEIINKFKCEVIVVSLGAQGAILVTKNSCYQITPPNVNVQSTVGAGDSMLAGIVYGLQNHKDLVESARFGVACGTAATMNQGTELCHLNDVKKIYQNMEPPHAI
ncbi:1-phosphofructokinase family hexose kinase [Pedobacter nyackensis]|nr:hexose kinase [Pedobacter nyackensis]